MAMACVLLVVLVGFVQAVHVHAESSSLPGHECSLCSVAHAGVIRVSVFDVVQTATQERFSPTIDLVSCLFRPLSSLTIRPPPSA